MSVLMSLAMFPTDTKGSKSKEVAQVLNNKDLINPIALLEFLLQQLYS